jgi:hypothetical protein
MIRCGSGGAQHGHLTVRRMGIHVHLLSARVGAVMKTYLYENGETFERERNEPAPRSIVELLRYVRSFRWMPKEPRTLRRTEWQRVRESRAKRMGEHPGELSVVTG